MAIADAVRLPPASQVLRLMEKVPDSLFISGRPDRLILIGGKAYDSGSLNAKFLQKQGIELAAPPHRRNKKAPPS